MTPLTGDQIRESYLRWFEARDHARYPSDSLVPSNDPTLLFTGAGMNQFKDMFLGKGTLPHRRITTSQKCLRVPDLENVGLTAGHHTFFEMLGNFSFGDYFKQECLEWVLGWFTDALGIPRERIVVSVYVEDDEAFTVWRDDLGVPEERIYRFGEKENFWPAEAPSKGPNGPCGPCTEVYYDYEPDGPLPANDGLDELPSRFIEIGNCVFTQFDRQPDGSLPPLPQKNIDVGLGLERITAVVQGVRSNFETDVFRPYIERIAATSGRQYGAEETADVHMRRIADHARAVTHCIADGALPSNDGRGYVVRKILRRACRDGYEIGIEEPFLHELAGVVVETMSAAYPNLHDARKQIAALVLQEERAFRQIYTHGVERLKSKIEFGSGPYAPGGAPIRVPPATDAPPNWDRVEFEGKGSLPVVPGSGEVAFELHDTHGFPADITRAIFFDHDYAIDDAGFDAAMEAQRERARQGSALSGDVFADNEVTRLKERRIAPTEFTGYDRTGDDARIVAIVRGGGDVERADAGDDVELVLDRTPAYAEAGGQVGDRGLIRGPDGGGELRDVQGREGYSFHAVRVAEGRLSVGDTVRVEVDGEARRATERNHTATHLLHQALKNVLGEHIGQAGSLVAPDRLRFDFTHGERLTDEQIAAIEDEVNEQILAASEVRPEWMPLARARRSGFVAMFGEKYGDEVRTLTIGDGYSRELCGGTHVRNTGNIGVFRILADSSVAAGVRRIEAATGRMVLDAARADAGVLDDLARRLKTRREELPARVESLQQEIRKLRKDVERAKASGARDVLGEIEQQLRDRDGAKVVAGVVEGAGNEELLDLLDRLRKRHQSFAGILFGRGEGAIAVVAAVTKDLIADGVAAKDLVRDAAKTLGGGGGGRPEMAQGRGRDASKLDAALEEAWAALS